LATKHPKNQQKHKLTKKSKAYKKNKETTIFCYVDIFGLHLNINMCYRKSKKDHIKMSKHGQIFFLARIKS